MIGIFDSGIGGLTVVQALQQFFPEYDMIYFGDTARTPYGNKSPDTITQYAIQDTEFLVSQGAKIIVVACNTASSVAPEKLREIFHVPIFEVISPAAELAVQMSKKKIIGVIGTRATINSSVYVKKIKTICADAVIHTQACPLLVPLVEEGWLKKPETRSIVKKYLIPLKTRQIDTLILGCTHYPVLKSIIQRKIGLRVHIIDSSIAVAQTIKEYLTTHSEIDRQLTKNRNSLFFVSDVTPQFQNIGQILLKRNIKLNVVKL